MTQHTTEAAPADTGKNPHAVALGRLGGVKGGPARAKKLSPERRREIAQKAIAARWAKRAEGERVATTIEPQGLEREAAFFEEHRADYLARFPGLFVLIKGSQMLGPFP